MRQQVPEEYPAIVVGQVVELQQPNGQLPLVYFLSSYRQLVRSLAAVPPRD